MKRSKHSLSHYRLLTTKMGQLTPLGKPIEVLPGDSFQHSTSLLIRCAPLNAPVMHPIIARVHHWFVPTRLLWANFTSFITGGASGTDATVPPTITMTPTIGTLADYLGLPLGTSITPSALRFRGYALIFNEFYRDQDLVTALPMSTGDGADVTTNTTLQNCAWEKDYFTTSRPWTQKGTAVTLPLGSSATVKTSPTDLYASSSDPLRFRLTGGAGAPTAAKAAGWAAVTGDAMLTDTATAVTGQSANGVFPMNLYADLTTATAATINALRRAFALQKYEEARALYGSRYVEYLRYLNVKSSDARLQRPEYLGGGKQTIQFSEVIQSGVTTSGTPTTGVGSLLGHGIGAVRSNRYRRFFEEHGYVFSLLSVLPKTMYVNGLPKDWSYSTKEDYWQKELERIGQQEVYNRETYVAHSQPAAVFGYQDRYDQYRREESGVSGLFRTTLNYWHDARIFAADTALNSTFVQSNPSSRIFQDTSSDHLYVMANHSIQARRLVSHTGVPGGVI